MRWLPAFVFGKDQRPEQDGSAFVFGKDQRPEHDSPAFVFVKDQRPFFKRLFALPTSKTNYHLLQFALRDKQNKKISTTPKPRRPKYGRRNATTTPLPFINVTPRTLTN